jgi:hypothetical protein
MIVSLFDCMQITGEQVACSRTKTITRKKTLSSKCCGLLRAFAKMTEIANEPKPRSKLLRACELLESFIARPAQMQNRSMRPSGKNEALDRY